MQPMAAPLKHLIDPAPADRLALVPATASCQVVGTLAGDCSVSLGERLREVEAACGFGQRCGRGCHGSPPPDCGWVGAGRVSVGQVAHAAAPSGSGNAERFRPVDLP